MDYEQKIRYLWRAAAAREEWQAAGKRLQELQDRIRALRESRTAAASPKLTGMPRSPSPDDGMGSYFIKLLEMEDREREMLDDVRKKYIRVIVEESLLIKTLSGQQDQELLEYRFLLNHSFNRLAAIFEISEASVRRRIRKGVEGIPDENFGYYRRRLEEAEESENQ